MIEFKPCIFCNNIDLKIDDCGYNTFNVGAVICDCGYKMKITHAETKEDYITLWNLNIDCINNISKFNKDKIIRFLTEIESKHTYILRNTLKEIENEEVENKLLEKAKKLVKNIMGNFKSLTEEEALEIAIKEIELESKK